ncbi:GGDEF domain-containing protein [Sporosarcina sp.]|uniref:GGDEF domain-containing protein n=1 Tax=Sporosarcina sp. TaxID=49982 RepID=UPI00261EFE0A|nr:GGDEF domain-containing protein [Sporosarcina sp.]
MLIEHEISSLQRSIIQYRSEGHYDKVTEAAAELLEKGILLSDAEAILSAHYISALANYYVGNFEKVLFHIEAHHESCLSFGTKSDWMRSFYLQYFVSTFASDYEHGRKLIEDVLSIALEIEDFIYVGIAYSNLSYALNKLGKFPEAMKAAQQAVKFANLYSGDRLILSVRAHLHLIQSSLNLERCDVALTSINCLNQLSELDDFPREKAFLTILKGRLHELLEHPTEAFRFYTLAKEKEELLHDYVFLKEIQQKRIALAEKLCSFDELALIQKEYIDLLHEVENQNWIKASLELKLRLQNSAIKTNEHIDFLTGVYNRKYLEETTDKWLADSVITKDSIVCIAFDLDNLKVINDAHGHLAGDEAIKLVAKICSSEIRKDDLLGRFGGDEFVLVMKSITLENAKKKALEIAKKVKALSLGHPDISDQITISIGLADNHMRDVKSFKDLFHLADLALYRAKRNGKNQLVSFV